MKWVVVGAGAWGSAFAKLVHERDHDVTLACRDAALAAHIAATGRNERYLPDGDLQGVAATTIDFSMPGMARSVGGAGKASPARPAEATTASDARRGKAERMAEVKTWW